jgi:hypothetical protein
MLFNDRILFLHVPKTAGMAVTEFLIRNLPGPVTLTEPPETIPSRVALPLRVRAKLQARALLKRWRLWYPRRVTLVAGKRHERLAEARATLARLGRNLENFPVAIAVIRNPYDMEVSRYHFMRLGYHGEGSLARGPDQRIAIEANFEQFALNSRFDGRPTARIEQWYEIDGRTPENLRLLRFEALEDELQRVLGEFYSFRVRLPRTNVSPHASYRSYLTPAAEAAIYRKYQWVFDKGFYPREHEAKLRNGGYDQEHHPRS